MLTDSVYFWKSILLSKSTRLLYGSTAAADPYNGYNRRCTQSAFAKVILPFQTLIYEFSKVILKIFFRDIEK